MNNYIHRVYNNLIQKFEDNNTSPIKKKLVFQHIVIQKNYAPLSLTSSHKVTARTEQIHPHQRDTNKPIKINTIFSECSSPLLSNRQCKDSRKNSTLKSADTKNQPKLIRCKSAYSRIQVLKDTKKEKKPDKMFSSVSFLFNRKNSIWKNSNARAVTVGSLKIQGFGKSVSSMRIS